MEDREQPRQSLVERLRQRRVEKKTKKKAELSRVESVQREGYIRVGSISAGQRGKSRPR